MDTNVSRVLRLFRLSVPPVFFLLACYVFLGEHVFGLAYVVGKRLKPRLRATLRGLYRLSSAFIAFVMHAYLWYACADDDEEGAPLCPRTRFKERHCLAITSASALYCGATLLVERWANPMLGLDQPTGAARARVRRNGARAHVVHHRGPAAVRAPAAAALHGAPHARALSKGGEGLRDVPSSSTRCCT